MPETYQWDEEIKGRYEGTLNRRQARSVYPKLTLELRAEVDGWMREFDVPLSTAIAWLLEALDDAESAPAQVAILNRARAIARLG